MLTFAEKYAFNIHSQNGEDGILEEIINRIQPEKKTAIEFGAPTWEYCSNTAYLATKGWLVRMFDINPNDSRISKAEITPENVNQIVGDCTLLSIDVDGQDYHIWKAYHYRPDIVIIEINSSLPPMSWEVPGDRGTSYRPMVQLGLNKLYFLLCHTGNLIFVRMEFLKLFPEILKSHPLANWEKYFNTSFL